MRTIYLFLGLMLVISSLTATTSESIYAGETISKKLPEVEVFKKGVIPEIPDLPGSYVTASVIHNTDLCLINCEFILNVTSDLILIPTDVKTTFKDIHGQEKIREYEYEHLVRKIRAKSCPEYTTEEIERTVFNNVTQQNESFLENITSVEYVFCGLENYTEWVSGVPTLQAGDSALIKIRGHKVINENIDVIPKLYGLSFSEWALWGGSWDYKKQINLTSGVDSELTNFPAHFILDTQSLIGNGTMQEDCDDLRVADETEEGELSFEIEGQTCNTTSTIVWVKIPTFYNSSTVNSVYAYYGNAGASEGNNTADVWSEGYERVFHFGEASYTGVALESSGNSKGTYTGSGTVSKPVGAIGQAVSFTAGVGNYVNTTNPNLFLGAETTTAVMAYDNSSLARSPINIQGIWTAYTAANIGPMFFDRTEGSQAYEFYSGGAVADGLTVDYDNAWEYWAQLQNSTTTSTIYVNGTIAAGGASGTAANGDSTIFIGQQYPSQDRTWRGFIDEYRLSSVRRTPDWILAEYAQDYVVGAEEVSQNPPVFNSSELGPATLYKNTTVWGAVSYNHTTEATYTAIMGLAINGTIIGSFNQTNASYSNGTIYNYTSFDISAYTHGDNVSLWTQANVSSAEGEFSEIEYTANITIGNYGPDIENLTITDPLYNGTNATGTADFWDLEGDSIVCDFNWYVNSTSIYNDTQSPCLNSSVFEWGNYTIGDTVNFIVNASDSEGDTGGPTNSSNVVVAAEPNASGTALYIWNGAAWIDYDNSSNLLRFRCSNPFPSYCQPTNQDNDTAQPIFNNTNDGGVNATWSAIKSNVTWATASLLCDDGVDPLGAVNLSTTYQNYSTSTLIPGAGNYIYCWLYVASVSDPFPRNFEIYVLNGGE